MRLIPTQKRKKVGRRGGLGSTKGTPMLGEKKGGRRLKDCTTENVTQTKTRATRKGHIRERGGSKAVDRVFDPGRKIGERTFVRN